MQAIATQLAKRIDWLNEQVGRSVSWLNLVLMILVCFDVVTRYLFNQTAAWVNELEWHLFAVVFLLGAGYALKHDRHVRVDLFFANFSQKDKALVNLLGSMLFLIPWSAILCYFAFFYSLDSWKMGETSPDPGGLPMRYLVKFAMVLGMFLLFLQGLSSLIHAALILSRKAAGNA
jgi:TRAP-type mannitol/chloroaromatic compound transport system permease small subunit